MNWKMIDLNEHTTVYECLDGGKVLADIATAVICGDIVRFYNRSGTCERTFYLVKADSIDEIKAAVENAIVSGEYTGCLAGLPMKNHS